MESTNTCSVSLRITSDNVSAKELSNLLATEPTRAHDKGQQINPNSKRPRVAGETIWFLASSLPEDNPLEDHIDKILTFCEDKKHELSSLSSRCQFDVFCCVTSNNGQGGFVLNHSLIKRMTQFNIDFIFDTYFLSE